MTIRNAEAGDAAAITTIYNHFIVNTAVSFEEVAVPESEMVKRITEVQAGGLPFLVAIADGVVVGYAYATKWRARHAYRYSVESTVYLAPGHGGKGHGSTLYRALLERLRLAGCHLVIGGITQPNEASVALHEKLGFQKVAHFSEVGFKFGRWIDVGYWELKLALPS